MKTKRTTEDAYLKSLGEALTYYREQCGLTQKEASKKIGKSRTWLSDKEAGRGDIYFGDIDKLCKLYGIKTNDIKERMGL